MTKVTHPILQGTHFLKSVNHLSQLPPDVGLEVAFAGRSNAGKSSAINTITGIKSLARTSKTPGRTQLINYFTVAEQRYLVDLPGYGFAKVPERIKQHWHQLLNRYMEERQSLQALFLMMDIRHPLKPLDQQLLDWALFSQIPCHILLTKADKLKRSGQKDSVMRVKKALSGCEDLVSIQAFSAFSGLGVEEAQLRLIDWLTPDTEDDESTEEC